MADNYFVKLYGIDCNSHTEKKNGLTYLSWAWAWAEVKKVHPDATYTVYENSDGWNYFTDGKTCWVKTGVTISGIEHIEYLPVMDFRNKSIPVGNVTSFDVNKTIQRSLTKACARHGLGLYIYAGEDLPEEDPDAPKQETKTTAKKQKASVDSIQQFAEDHQIPSIYVCEACGMKIKDFPGNDGKVIPASKVIEVSRKRYGGKCYCANCQKDMKEKKNA